ncbi:helix-turn-helix domain-containing protein [Clostridium sp. 'White wine YQ']|uniref:helix-turn-helix domain-containing protein n=1 Tax=Clostridium sp. 'White wine YQ' TaxID=3027474 RepID=UPI0023661F42|nr:helix-turn-helix transcriptional regulator [Clostridium sp. 'White wine YQ']MDD7794441.1 helix-turn-helix transcriptional regulator [Clostridium sp. 'White wine YQ']
MYDAYESDEYFFNNDAVFLIENKDREKLINLTLEKHKNELLENISPVTKRNDLLIWNVLFAREVITNGTSKQYLHTLYNKFYKQIQETSKLSALQKIELDMINSYFDILINYLELKDNLVINKIIGYLYYHIEDKVSLENIASDLKLSVGYISNTFKKNIGITIMRYFKQVKIDRAKVLLVTTDKSVLEISTLLCFCDQGNFSKTFKSIVGMTPLDYRNSSSLK